MNLKKMIGALSVMTLVMGLGGPASSECEDLSSGGTVYVPAYSSIFHSNLRQDLDLAVTLSIHNIDRKNHIIIDVINYYNTEGSLRQKYVDKAAVTLRPLQTYNLGIRETDRRGGIGANFIVRWRSKSPVNRPVIESIMISTKGQQGISFSSRGVTILE